MIVSKLIYRADFNSIEIPMKVRDAYSLGLVDRLKEQKFQVKCLTALYINSHDVSSS